MNSVFEFSDYRDYLKCELEKKSAKNRGYSLRSMARHLSVSPSTLSAVIGKRKNLSDAKASVIAERLSLETRERECFLMLVQLATVKCEKVRDGIRMRLAAVKPRRKTKRIRTDEFNPISNWYNMALLEICGVAPISDGELTVLAKEFSVPPEALRSALDRMCDLGLVRRDGKHYLRNGLEEVIVKSDLPNAVIRAYHEQVQRRASRAIRDQGPDLRFSASEFFQIAAKDVGAARLKITQFLDELHDLAGASEGADQVYGLSLTFFNVFDSHSKKEAAHEN